MFFIFGLIMGAIAGFMAVAATGAPLLLGRGLGLLWGDRRWWWTLALIVGVFAGLFLVASSHRFKIQTDQLAKGFVSFQQVGVYAGAIICWGLGMLLLQRWGSGWRPSIVGLSWALSLFALFIAASSCVDFHSRPEKIRKDRSAHRTAW